LPLLFCLMPLPPAVIVAAAIPEKARDFYLRQIVHSPMDWLILGLGAVLFLTQLRLSWQALQWRAGGFDARAERRLSHAAQAAEWFPMLGLIGTVAGILQTFSSIKGQVSPAEIIALYAPAITATGSGLLMALINILPIWVVQYGQEKIKYLGSGPEPSREMSP
jgi:hypothetical protein